MFFSSQDPGNPGEDGASNPFIPIFMDDIIAVTPIESKVIPPDPGEAGSLTLDGIDFDGDEIRDDAERYIAYKYLNGPPPRGALYQLSRSMNHFLYYMDIGKNPSGFPKFDRRIESVQCLTPITTNRRAQQ